MIVAFLYIPRKAHNSGIGILHGVLTLQTHTSTNMCFCLNKTLFYKNLHFKLPVHTKFVEFCDNFTYVGVELKIRCHFSLTRNQLSNNTQVYIDGAVGQL